MLDSEGIQTFLTKERAILSMDGPDAGTLVFLLTQYLESMHNLEREKRSVERAQRQRKKQGVSQRTIEYKENRLMILEEELSRKFAMKQTHFDQLRTLSSLPQRG